MNSQAATPTSEANKQGLLIVGISEMKMSRHAADTLVTYSLGSCIGVSIYDPVQCIGGLIHCMLPTARQEPDRAKTKPYMFVDSGVSAMLKEILDLGAEKKRLVIKASGGAAPLDSCGRFRIGERNIAILRKLLWKNDLMLTADDTGGTQPRTMSLLMDSGRVTIRTNREELEL